MRLVSLGSLLTLCLFVLCACATSNIDKNYFPTEESGKGVVVGSLTYFGAYSGYMVHYRQLGGTAHGRFQTGQTMVMVPPFLEGKDFERTTGVPGDLFAVELPAGTYEIFNWTVGSGYATVSPERQFSIRFQVLPGKTVYVGNFHFRQTARFGLTVTGATALYRDEFERDIRYFLQEFSTAANNGSVRKEAIQSFDNLGGTDGVVFNIPIFIVR